MVTTATELTAFQAKVLNALLDKYESSKAQSGPPNCKVRPANVYPAYVDNLTDVDDIREFDSDMSDLALCGMIKIRYRRGEIEYLDLVPEKADAIYQALHRQRKEEIVDNRLRLYSSFITDTHDAVTNYCENEINNIRSGKLPKLSDDLAPIILTACRMVQNNQEEILEREFSMRLFEQSGLRLNPSENAVSFSKIFQSKYRSKVCNILKEYATDIPLDDGMSDTEQQHQILEHYQIYANPVLIIVKGEGEMRFTDGDSIKTHDGETTPITAKKLRKLQYIWTDSKMVMTVENETSFESLNDPAYFYIYLGGYANTAQKAFITNIAKFSRIKQWFHFGDMDPFGFRIWLNLRQSTNLDFVPWHMGVEEYLFYGNQNITSPLTKIDNKVLQSIMMSLEKDASEYAPTKRVLLSMSEHQYKFEQEIVSYNLSRGRRLS